MKWIFIFAVLFIASCSGMIDEDQNSGSVTDSASGSGSGSASGGASAGPGGATTETTVQTQTMQSTESPDATGTASATASVVVNTPSTTPPLPATSDGNKPTAITTPAPTTAPTTAPTGPPPPSPTPSPQPPGPTASTTTSAPTSKPPPPGCDPCKQPDFRGFSFKPGKCGCCPWPCCCKCVEVSGGDAGPCRALLDLAFIMDDSGSIGSTDWVVAKQFFKDVVSSLTSIGTDQFVSSITFSTNATLNWNLNDFETDSALSLGNSISALQQSGELTNPVEAMEIAIDQVFVDGIDNLDAANVAVLMTDGRANYRKNEISDMAARLRGKASLICIGVTNKIDMSELRKICDDDKIFSVVDFASLASILKSLQTQICPTPTVNEKCFCCCTPEQYFGGRGPFW